MPTFAYKTAGAESGTNNHSVSMLDAAKVQSKNKISKRLLERYKKDDVVTFLVKFRDQVDTKKVAGAAASKAKKSKATAYKLELMKRSAIVSSLRAKANETQHDVKSYLTKQKKKGEVKSFHSYYIVNGMAVTATKQTAERLATFPEIEKVLPNETRQLDPIKKKQVKAKKSKANSQTSSIEWNIEKVGAPEVWDMGIDGSGTVVANIDTGVQWNHPALKEKYRGYDAASNTVDHEFNWFDATAGQSAPYDDQGHGTHTMGTMVGSDGDNHIGVAPGAKWIAVKAFTAAGGTDADLLAAGEWILAPKDAEGNPHPEMAPDVVNNSWGGGPGLDEWYRPMVQNWRAAGIFPEFSAGNTTLTNPGGPGSVANPGNYPESFTTGATDINDQLAGFSLQGPSPYDEIKPDVSAPGVNIRSSVPGSQYEGGWNGTSMAGPHVAAAAALLLQADSSLTVDDIEQILMDTAVPLTDEEFPESPNNGYGYGRIDVYNAVQAVADGLGTVQGQVTKDGEDLEAPVYQHDGPNEAYAGAAIPLDISVQDNVSITKVELQYRVQGASEWQTVEAEKTSGDYRNAVYQAVIPGDVVAEPAMEYKWTITDYGQNNVTSDQYDVTIHPALTNGYQQDFEANPIGWLSYGDNNTWEWGKPTSGPAAAASGEKVYATNLDRDYENNSNMTLMMPPVAVPEAGNMFLQFKQWYNIENNYDYGHVFVSTDQQNWEQLAEFTGESDGWQSAEVDLSDYAGQTVFVAFHVQSDGSVPKAGWYLDDVALSDTAMGETAKAHLGVQPKHGDKDKKENKIVKNEKAKDKKANKKPVDPSKMKPSKPDVLVTPDHLNVNKDAKVKPSSLPLAASVTVLETDRSVRTDPADGHYTMTHAAGDYTLKAEAYGFHPVERSVEIPRDGFVTADFKLDPIAKGTITGTITNKATGEPIAGADIMLMEDAAVAPVSTDENGHFSIEAYEGDYTMHVSARKFYSQDVSVTVEGDQSVEKDVNLKPFIGYPGEIGYDDGTAENAHAFYDAGNGWAVKMSLPEGKDHALVTGGLFRFWNTEWPVPGGTEFQVAIYDASGPDGAPGKKLAGPIDATALRNDQWTNVDLSGEGVVVDGDFYMVYIQTQANPNAPGLATDENGENHERSWQLVGGAWSKSPKEEGNYMIRAQVSYEAAAPVITSPKDGTFTKNDKVTVEGEAAPGMKVTILNNGEKAATTNATDEGTFSKEITLQKGENKLTATVSTDNGTTDPSEPVTIVLDQIKPKLSIDSPKDDYKTNKMAVKVEGKVDETNLAWVKVNGQKAKVNDDGSYEHRMLLDDGDNTIKVVARDKAGNKRTKRITVHAKFDAPVVENLKPDEDVNLKSGESVKIELDSEPGLKATFAIRMPLVNTIANTANVNELPMMETEDGHYVGYWTAPSGLKADGGEIEVILKDDYGNETRELAKGKLHINVKKKK
ncbi:S8 family serine peptidase [Scopulibacillus darangshiensis]